VIRITSETRSINNLSSSDKSLQMPILDRVNENASLLFQSGGEDVEMATCLQNIGIYGEHSADQTGVG
jgi:hypothetical protein